MKFVVVDPPFVRKEDWKKIEFISEISEMKIYDDPPSNAEDVIQRIYDADLISADIFIQFNKEILSKAKRLKGIFTQAVGYDNFDVAYAKKKGIKVYNAAGYNSNAVAEFVFSLIVTLIRRIPAAQSHVKVGGWEYKFFAGSELSGKTIGVVGSGNVAQGISKIARGFGMNVLVHTLNPTSEKATILGIKKWSSLRELLKNADVLTLAVPLTENTKGLIGAEELKYMKKSAILINTSRHTVVDEFALAEALVSEQLAGAALDVILKEPFTVQKYPMLIQEMVNLPNVIVTPHIGGVTQESTVRLGEFLLQNVQNFLKGDTTNCVNC